MASISAVKKSHKKKDPAPLVTRIVKENMDELHAFGAAIVSSAVEIKAAAQSIITTRAAGEKQLYRKVILLVYDKDGTRITSTNWDLKEDDSLSINVSADEGVESAVLAGSR
jgi:hypothetical protein